MLFFKKSSLGLLKMNGLRGNRSSIKAVMLISKNKYEHKNNYKLFLWQISLKGW